MGRIPQYQRQKFMSSYVGGPVEDKSGEILTSGIAKAGEQIINVEAKKLQERNNMMIDAQAESVVLDYGMAYQRGIKGLESQYADNPEGFSQAVADYGTKLRDEYVGKIGHEKVATRAGGAMGSVILQAQKSALSWESAKFEANAQQAAYNNASTIQFSLSNVNGFEAFKYTLDEADSAMAKIPNIQAEQIRKAREGIVDTYVYLQAQNDPDGFEEELGEYSKIADKLPKDFYEKAVKQIDASRKRRKSEVKQIQIENKDNLLVEMTDDKFPLEIMLQRIDESKNKGGIYGEDGLDGSDYRALKNAMYNRIKGGVSDIDVKSKPGKYLEALNKLNLPESDKRARQAVILDMWSSNKFSKDEIDKLNKIYGFTNNIEHIQNGASALLKGLDKLFPGDPVRSVYAGKVIDALVKGEDPTEVFSKVTKEASVAKVVRDNPALAQSKDPVEDMYRQQAINQLRKDGQPTRPENVQWMIDQLKAMDGNANR